MNEKRESDAGSGRQVVVHLDPVPEDDGRAAAVGQAAPNDCLAMSSPSETASRPVESTEPEPEVDRACGRTPPRHAGTSAADETLPQCIGRYTVIDRLDQGGQGRVFRVQHPHLSGEYVLKLAHQTLAVGSPIRNTLVSEGRILSGLQVPDLARVVDLDFDANRPFLVLEYVPGQTLHQYAIRERPSPRQAARLVARLARTVDQIHRQGLVHLDIKPRNVVLDAEHHPRLIDFGLARLRDAWSEGWDHPTGGTPAFMSPEQARSDVNLVGPASDVFGLGAVLYFMLTGKAPFQGKDRIDTLAQASRCEFDRAALKRAGVPLRFSRIILHAMEESPESRPATALALAAELEAACSLPRRQALTLCAGGLALLAGASLYRWWPSSQPPPGRLTLRLDVTLFPRLNEADRAADREGLLGERVFTAREGDDVAAFAHCPEPVHAFLMAFRPDGKIELCAPEDEASPPRPDQVVQYPPPSEKAIYRLEEGAGLHAFVVVASRRPLPSFQTWRARLKDVPWQARATGAAGVVWRHDGQRLLPQTSSIHAVNRGKGARPQGEHALLSALASWLHNLSEIDGVAFVAFPVERRSEPEAQ